MKQEHLDNLTKLADFLEKELTDKQFNIRNYLTDEGSECKIVIPKEYECGTIGCAIGWAPFALGNEGWDGKSFCRYAESNFGCSDSDEDIGTYMFSSDWYGTPQETRLATVDRIREVVKQDGLIYYKQIDLMRVYGV